MSGTPAGLSNGAWKALEAAAPEFASALAADDELKASVERVVPFSQFVTRIAARYPAEVAALATSGDLRAARSPQVMSELVAEAAAAAASETELLAALRRVRHTQMLRIAWRDLAGWAPLNEVLEDLSALADSCIQQALAFAMATLGERHGLPRHADGRVMELLVVAMGKLGGGELNFSSDIDLVLVYPGPGQTDGRRAVDHQLFFQRTGQLLIRLLDAVTADGQAYRVDTRLRPFGDSGALAISLASLDLYLQQHGRDWERYAWVKARAVTGTEEDHAALASVVRPFVFRGYVDYGVLVSLRDMKQRISREVERQDRTDDVKLGAGGIREVEFVVQSYQLLRGGRDRTLRSPQLGTVLPLLAERGLLSRQACRELDSGYEFLRRTENRLQAVDDKQTHTLPADASDLARLALSMGFEDAAQFSAALGSHRERVASHFEALAFAPSERPEAAGEAALAGAWEGSLAADAAEQALTELGFADAPAALAVLRRMREGGVYRRLDGQGARRLDALMPNLLAVVAELGDHQQRTLERMVNIIEAIGRRSAYVALLNENPPVLGRLVDLIASSAWIADQVAALPLLLDELIDPQIFLRPPNRTMLRQDMVTRFTGIAPEDLEAQMEALRQFQQAAVFQVAVADLSGELPLMSVSDRLTDIAELVLKKALELAQWQLRERHGVPRCGADGREAGFAIIAYGKLGGFELGYGSDLDLVFVHNSTGASQQSDGEQPLVNERYFVRLAQRLLHILSTQTRSGKLYEVDTRLRPSGKGGALVTSLAGFERYQHEQAWVWEHQALLRTRAVAGNPVVCAAYERIRRQTLTRPVEESSLRAEVVKMRKRMRSELDRSRGGAFDIKQGAGGLTDIEFLVQFLVLKSATDNPHLVTHSDNIRQLHDLADSGLLADADAVTLIECYRAYRQRMHRLSLAGGNRLVPEGEVSERRRQITQLWQRGLGEALGVE